ncbi:serine/threonine protein kinase [Motilibacter rhizosphaerae]|uniref:Serine/threonine protein kinase n=1 Tax=Motilibacter rhizosphaerae TaxID=598652 RepID=A0A4V2F492_9ACTN|nr:serine/threonine-protein kinase [Motilibacter rhizosphaerae]RZS86797.1 serine/threonine protein kinase [Motilibacter rhizosphaerae]
MDVLDAGARLGPYQLLARIGEGGMGVVHLALDPEGRAVAVKVLRPHVLDDSGRERLAREVAALRRVGGEHVASVVDADLEATTPYVVMRYVQGRPLPERVERHGAVRGDELHALAAGLGAALVSLHAAGVVHRDVKPGNVLLAEGQPVLVDFGLAHVLDTTRLTATGLFLGTPGYLPPETVRGSGVTPAADVYGWGATVAFAATGRPPFGSGAFEVVLARVLEGEPDLDGVPDELLALVVAALDPEPAARPSAQEVAALGGGAATTLAVVRPAAPRAPEPRPALVVPPGVPVVVHGTVPREPVAPYAPPPLPPRPPSAPVLLAALVVVLAAVCARAPVVGGALVVAGAAGARAVDLASRARRSRAARRGPGRSDPWVAGALAPWHLLRALAATAVTLPLGLLGAAGTALAAHALLPPGGADLHRAGAAAAAAAVGAALLCWGPGCTGVRRGAARVLLAGGPSRASRAATGLLALVAAALLVLSATAEPAAWPLGSLPDLALRGYRWLAPA